MIDLRDAQWRTSSRSSSQGQCVEVARNLEGVVAVRDSKDPDGPVIVVDHDAWLRFLSNVVWQSIENPTVTDQPARPPIAAAIIVQDGRVLMVRRRVREGSLSWQFPAGELEPGETPEATAVRETGEEVGLTVRALRRLGERVHPATGRQMAYVACEPVSGTARLVDDDELDAVAW